MSLWWTFDDTPRLSLTLSLFPYLTLSSHSDTVPGIQPDQKEPARVRDRIEPVIGSLRV